MPGSQRLTDKEIEGMRQSLKTLDKQIQNYDRLGPIDKFTGRKDHKSNVENAEYIRKVLNENPPCKFSPAETQRQLDETQIKIRKIESSFLGGLFSRKELKLLKLEEQVLHEQLKAPRTYLGPGYAAPTYAGEGYSTPGTSPGSSARSDASAGVPFSAGYSPDNSARSNSSASTDSSYPSYRGFGAYPSQSSDSSYPSQREEVNYPSGAPADRAPTNAFTQPGPDYPSRQNAQDSARQAYGPYTSQQSPPATSQSRPVGADYPSRQNYHQNPSQAYATNMNGQTPHARPDPAAVAQARADRLHPNAAPANAAAQQGFRSGVNQVRQEGEQAKEVSAKDLPSPPGFK